MASPIARYKAYQKTIIRLPASLMAAIAQVRDDLANSGQTIALPGIVDRVPPSVNSIVLVAVSDLLRDVAGYDPLDPGLDRPAPAFVLNHTDRERLWSTLGGVLREGNFDKGADKG